MPEEFVELGRTYPEANILVAALARSAALGSYLGESVETENANGLTTPARHRRTAAIAANQLSCQ